MRSGRCGGGEVVGETQHRPFQLSFNSSLKVDFQGSRVTSHGGLVLVRELDERLGFGELIKRHLADSRGKNRQLPLADLLRQSVYSRLAGYEDMNDAERVSQDPTFRLIGSEKIWERGRTAASRDRAAAEVGQRGGVSSRRGLRQAGDLRGAGGAGREVCHPHSGERQRGEEHRGVVDAACGSTEPQAGGLVQGLS